MTASHVPHNKTGPYSKTVLVGGVPFSATNIDDAVNWIIGCAAHGAERSSHVHGGTPVRLANAYCVALADQDARYRQLLCGTGVNLPDGAPIAWAMRYALRRHPSRAQRVRGPSLFLRVMDRGRPSNVAHFLLGTTEPILAQLQDNLLRRYPGLVIKGTFAPPFGPMSEEWLTHACETIASSRPSLIWVAMGTPKQDWVARELAKRTGITTVGVGAAFDFAAGTRAEAPIIVQVMALEWLFRLATEPKRLWKRYLFGNIRFLWALFRRPPVIKC